VPEDTGAEEPGTPQAAGAPEGWWALRSV